MGAFGTRFDDRYGFPGVFDLLRCSSCGHITLDVAMTSSELSQLYTNYYPRSTFDIDLWSPPTERSRLYSWWRGLNSSAYRWVPRNVRVLDIGCGFGESLGYHRNRGCDAQGVEVDRNILRVAARHGLNVKVGLFDETAYAPASFDVVTLDQVIEHVSDPLPVLRGIHSVLRPNGILVISTPNADGWGARVFGRRWVHWHAPYHQQFFSTESIGTGALKTGFVVEQKRTVTNSAWLDFQWQHLLAFPKPGQPSTAWNSNQRRSLTERIALRLLLWIDRSGLNSLVTRVFDALRLGDNTVFVLRKASS
jgi:2-polyprenyl-3-methyl-5-hydroxy-6-metoxy-1,4-benzoquinol methylase